MIFYPCFTHTEEINTKTHSGNCTRACRCTQAINCHVKSCLKIIWVDISVESVCAVLTCVFEHLHGKA